jgi:hypothetical protein
VCSVVCCAFSSFPEVGADRITDHDISAELPARLCHWRGEDKLGRPCLVITGRHMRPNARRSLGATSKSFQKVRVEESSSSSSVEVTAKVYHSLLGRYSYYLLTSDTFFCVASLLLLFCVCI